MKERDLIGARRNVDIHLEKIRKTTGLAAAGSESSMAAGYRIYVDIWNKLGDRPHLVLPKAKYR